jgi:hypothetical protein
MNHGFTLASDSLADELPSSQQQSVIEASLSEQVSKLQALADGRILYLEICLLLFSYFIV